MDKPYFEGLNEYDKETFSCSGYDGCLYNQNGRCIYNIAPIKERLSKACYEDETEFEMEDKTNERKPISQRSHKGRTRKEDQQVLLLF